MPGKSYEKKSRSKGEALLKKGIISAVLLLSTIIYVIFLQRITAAGTICSYNRLQVRNIVGIFKNLC